MPGTKLIKKGRSSASLDNWLDTLGLYRKNVAYDETCLFRAVSEQIFGCQIYHERVRRECIEYARTHYHEFKEFFSSEKQFQDHLNLMEKHMIICGNTEINIVSRKYNKDVTVFDANKQHFFNITKRNLPESLLLCLMDKDHYDVVYKKEIIETAGFCQSIVYKVLYENVFKIPQVDEIVNIMLYDKTATIPEGEKKFILSDNDNGKNEIRLGEAQQEAVPLTNIAPFPYKVAKALDPNIYRNIEYDSWGEVRRELRLGDWYYGDDKLILGTRCILKDAKTNSIFDCYIQEILKNQNKCVVYLTKTAEKRTVDYADLSPENDAKPWPLPYRFSKNLVIGAPPPANADKTSKSGKKRTKDKRRTKSCSESSLNYTINSNTVNVNNNAIENSDPLNPYVGIPLQMQNAEDSNNYHNKENSEGNTAASDNAINNNTPEVVITSEINAGTSTSSSAKFMWDQQQPQPVQPHTPTWQYLPVTPDPFVWPQTPSTPNTPVYNFNYRPMVASAPVTPDVYHEPNYSMYYNYNPYNPSYMYNQYPSDEFANQNPIQEPKEDAQSSNRNQTQSESFSSCEGVYEAQSAPIAAERPTFYSNLPLPNDAQPPAPVYSPIISIPPPIYYQNPSDINHEVMMPTTPIAMFTPPVEMQYVSPAPPFVYPPTPPASAWYPAGINSQGFIFPPPVNTQQTSTTSPAPTQVQK